MTSSATESGSAATLLRVEGATLGYPGTEVLRDVELRIDEHEFWFVIGPNGSGKTTLLRTLLGLIVPLSGRVERDSLRASLSRTGFVPQHCSFSTALPTTVREFVSLGHIGSDREPGERGDDLAWALDRSGLAGFAEGDYWSLSGGQRQRALVARALIRRPSLLLVDEPTEGMDLGSQDAFLETVESLHREQGCSVVFVTHHLEIAARYATHVALASEGGIFAGPRDVVLDAGHLSRAFGDRGEVIGRALASGVEP